MSLLANTTYASPTIPFWIAKVEAGNGITILGEDYAPIIQSDGLYTATGGLGITVSGGQDIQIDNTGVITVGAGNGITNIGTAQDPIIQNDGLLTATGGAGITVSGGQDCIIDNTGILSVSAGTSISIGGGAQTPIINNPDFFRNNYADSGRSIINRTVTTEIVVFTQNFILNANTTYIHAFSFNNFTISAVPGSTSYAVISRILPQGVGYPGVVSNLLINANDVWSRGIMQPFTSTNATNYTYELRVLVTVGTLNLRNIQTKIFRVS
jgi:hypothetical protein